MLKKGDKMITYWEVSEANRDWYKLFGTIPYKLTCQINNVIFNPPATIVFWSDGTKTVAKCEPCDKFDKEKGFAIAFAKKFVRNERFRKMLEKYVWEE